MVEYFKYFFLSILIISDFSAQDEPLKPGTDGNILKKEAQLSIIRDEISNLEKQLKEKSSAEKKSFESIENLNKQSFLLNKLIGSLRKEINTKQLGINNIQLQVNSIEDEIKVLKDNYAKYVVAVYKKGRYNELESLADAASLQQAVLRMHYLQVFSERRQKDLEDLKMKKTALAEAKNLLEKEKTEKSVLVLSKEDENKNLKSKLSERKKILTSIQNNKKELKKDIAAKKDAQKKIENLIAKLIVEAEERKRQEEIKSKEEFASTETVTETGKIKDENVGYEYDLNTSSFASFSELKGRMLWPLNKGKIIRKFGENKNKTLNTVTLNYGIDIKAGADKNVRCVGEGVISAIDWLPGYGNVIIVSHKGEYRTVYGHLSEIYISEGDKVKAGTVLAKVDDGLDGEVLHFELWKSRDKQNPELWLAKK